MSIVVLTGGPCGGKSTFLPIARQWLEDHGCIVATLGEAATEVINAGLGPMIDWQDPLFFQQELLKYQMYREDLYCEMLRARSHELKPLVLLCDRGSLDSMAFIGREGFLQVLDRVKLRLTDLRNSYTSVIHMMSAARGAEAYYTLTNNPARRETVPQATQIDHNIETAWLGHPHLTVIDNSTDFKQKLQRALAALARVVHMPEPLEIERKFLVTHFDYRKPPNIPEPNVAVKIEQTYLTPTVDGGERRVRLRFLDGVASYFYTEKFLTDIPGVRVEKERSLTQAEYETLLKEADPECLTLKKTRYCFMYEGRHMELDFYAYETWPTIPDLVVLEVEVASLDEELTLPDWYLKEVTGNPDYSNATLARQAKLLADSG